MNNDKLIKMLDKITEWALYLVLFFVPFSKSMIEITIVVAIVSWAFRKMLLRDFSIKRTGINALLFALFIVSALSIINTEFKALVIRSLVSKSLKYVLLYLVIIETVDSRVKLKNILKMGLISAVIVAMDSYIQHYLTNADIIRLYPSFKFIRIEPSFRGFPTGPFPFPNDLSAWLIMFLMPALYLFMWDMRGRVWRYLLGGFSLSLLFLLYLANTRSAWFSFFVTFFLTLIAQKKKIMIALVIVMMIAAFSFLPRQRVEDILGFTSTQDRLYMWKIGWRIFMEHPITGNGLNTFFVKFMEYREDEYRDLKGSHAHNGYLQMASDIGIVGLMIFLFLIGKVFMKTARYIRRCREEFYRTLALGLAAGLLAFLIHSFFDTNLQSLPLASLFWYALGILMNVVNAGDDFEG